MVGDGKLLDYRICGHDIDCKYSQKMGGWMLPPESFGQLLLVAHADDAGGTWSLGVVRASEENRRRSENRDGKTSLNTRGRQQVVWLHYEAELPPNVLLGLDDETLQAVLKPSSGQGRVNELLRRVTNVRIGRNTIATLARQADYMARLRDNGSGARTILRKEGYLIPGEYEATSGSHAIWASPSPARARSSRSGWSPPGTVILLSPRLTAACGAQLARVKRPSNRRPSCPRRVGAPNAATHPNAGGELHQLIFDLAVSNARWRAWSS